MSKRSEYEEALKKLMLTGVKLLAEGYGIEYTVEESQEGVVVIEYDTGQLGATEFRTKVEKLYKALIKLN